MTDPLEDRLRSHFAARAARVTAEPDPSALVERSAARPRLGVPLIAVLAAAVAVLTGGGFLTGMSVAGSSPAPTVPAGGAAPATSGAPNVAGGPASRVDQQPSTATVLSLTPLFTRTTTSGVTIRAYTSGTTVGVVPGPTPCPAGMMCAQPITTPTSPRGASANGGTGSTGSGSIGGTASSGGVSEPDAPIGTGTAVPPVTSRCQAVTLEMSTDRAVSSVTVGQPTGAAVAPNSVQLLGSGSFGEAEGGPVSWVAVGVGSGVTSVQLVESTGTVVDTMTPASGVVVLAGVGATLPGGTSVVGLDGAGATLATVPVDQGVAPAPDCSPVVQGPPVTPPTTVPTTVPGGSPTTTTAPSTTTTVPTTTTGPITTMPPSTSGGSATNG
jgi:hypothetical protein